MNLFFKTFLVFILLNGNAFTFSVVAQARLVMNGANITITNGAYLVLNNSASNAITRNSGQIISEGENNIVKWVLGESTGTYSLPWGYGASEFLPLSFTKTAGTGSGHFLFSTYRTGWQNSLSLPAGVPAVSGGGTDNSAILIDRFWMINAQGYTAKPSLINTAFGYSDIEHSATGNNIVENGLSAQRYNNVDNTWSDLIPAGTDDPSSNIVTVPVINGGDLYTWWTLVDVSSMLPLKNLAFHARNDNGKVRLSWTTTNEINIKEFEVQRSIDGINFLAVHKVPGKNSPHNTYEIFDEFPGIGKMYYRVRMINSDFSFSYSEIRFIVIKNKEKLPIYPNPVKNNIIFLDGLYVTPGIYHIMLFNVEGKIVYSSIIILQKNIVQIPLNALLQKGLYTLKVKGADRTFMEKLLIE